MMKNVRYQQIIELLQQKKSLSVQELQSTLNVSDMTVRRDLKSLEEAGVLCRVHGGATLEGRELPFNESSFNVRKVANIALKAAIAHRAISLIPSGSTVFIDGSSTCSELASLLIAEKKPVTVFTNSMDVMLHLYNHSHIHLVSLGGELATDGNTFDGPLAMGNAEIVSTDFCFFSAAGYTKDAISNGGMVGTMVKKTIVARSKRRILLADSTKSGKSGTIIFCRWNEIDTFISDHRLSDDIRATISAKGIEIILA